MARNIDDVSIDSATVDLKERGGDDVENRVNLRSVINKSEHDNYDHQIKEVSDTPKQRRASAMRRAAGTGAGYDNAPRGKSKQGRSEPEDKNYKH